MGAKPKVSREIDISGHLNSPGGHVQSDQSAAKGPQLEPVQVKPAPLSDNKLTSGDEAPTVTSN